MDVHWWRRLLCENLGSEVTMLFQMFFSVYLVALFLKKNQVHVEK